MPQPKRQSVTRKLMMSVYPPPEVACAVGEYNVTAFNQAIRIVAQVLGDAAVTAATRFTSTEWAVIADSFGEREVEPEETKPGSVLARAVERAHHRYKTGAPLGKNPDKAVADLAAKLDALSYLEAWAVIMAGQFHADPNHAVKEGDQWWDLAFRRKEIAVRMRGREEARTGNGR